MTYGEELGKFNTALIEGLQATRAQRDLVNYIRKYRALVEELEAEGLTTSDAQGCADAELYKEYGVSELTLIKRNPQAWMDACDAIEREGK